MIYGGYVDIEYKVIVEYTTVISAVLFFWTFSIDFKKFKMDVEKIDKPSTQVYFAWFLKNSIQINNLFNNIQVRLIGSTILLNFHT